MPTACCGCGAAIADMKTPTTNTPASCIGVIATGIFSYLASPLWLFQLIVGIAQHEAYHTGQIQLVKRLWQAAHPAR